MNIAYLLIMFSMAILTVSALTIYMKCARGSIPETGAYVVSVVAGACFVLMFVGSIFFGGKTISTDYTDFELEKTQFRIIVKTQGREYVFKDAESVLKADLIEKVKLSQSHNAWGFSNESLSATLIFKKNL